jgi:hypothetical protein
MVETICPFRRKVLLALAGGCLHVLAASAEGQLTLINSNSRVDFKTYALKVNVFKYDADKAFDSMDELRICESIDNSKLIVFGLGREKQFSRTSEFLFGTPSVITSIEAFFKRGGMIFFEPSSWAVYNSWAGVARKFFVACGVPVPDGSNYKNPSDNQHEDRNIDGVVVKGSGGEAFGGPRVPEMMRAIRYFDGEAAEAFEAYVVDAKGRKLIMGKRVDAGTVVFSLVYSVQRSAQSPFWDNVIESLYGKVATQKSAGRTVYLEEAKTRGLTGLYIREEPVFTQLFADTPLPEGGAELKHIDLLLARGEVELAEIVFYNCTEENRLYRLEPKMNDPNGKMFNFLDVKPRRNEHGRIQNEIVTPTDSSGTVFVPSGETKSLLLAAKTNEKPGTYEWSFELVSVNFEEEPRKITVTAEVLDLAMEGEMPNVYLFGPYAMTWAKGQVEKYQDFLADHYHVNYIATSGSIWKRVLKKGADGSVVLSDDPADYLSGEKRLQELGRRWIYGYGLFEAVNARMKELGVPMDWRDPKLVSLIDQALARWVKTLKENGIDFSLAYEPIRDEPSTKNIDEFIIAANLVRKHGMKVAVDIATWCTLDDVRKLAPHVDMWEPWEHRLTTRATGPEELAIYKASGKPIRPYLCSMSGNTDPYLDYHRFRGIKAFRLGGDGFCTWAANSWRGNDYRAKENQLDGVRGQYPGAFYLHHGDRQPVATMRLEALREGAEDLYWLRRAAKEGKAKELIADETLAALIKAQDPAEVRAWRNALLRALAQ